MPKAFARIPATEVLAFLDNKGEMPSALREALRLACDNAITDDQFDGEAPIPAFVTDDTEGEG